jgi:PAS domain S-box-containing protein
MEKEITSIDLIVSKADKDGNITYVNPIFIKISGYEHGELLGKPHSILRHPDMPRVIFKYLWENLQEGNDVVTYVKNLCKDNTYYWVIATIKTAKNPDGSFRNHMSTRRCITPSAKESINKLYEKLLNIEISEGIENSQKYFENFLTQNGLETAEAFNTYMLNLNK